METRLRTALEKAAALEEMLNEARSELRDERERREEAEESAARLRAASSELQENLELMETKQITKEGFWVECPGNLLRNSSAV